MRDAKFLVEHADERGERVARLARARAVRACVRRGGESVGAEGPGGDGALVLNGEAWGSRTEQLVVLRDNVEMRARVGDEFALVAVDGVAPVVVNRIGIVLAELALESAVEVVAPGGESVNTILAETKAT